MTAFGIEPEKEMTQEEIEAHYQAGVDRVNRLLVQAEQEKMPFFIQEFGTSDSEPLYWEDWIREMTEQASKHGARWIAYG